MKKEILRIEKLCVKNFGRLALNDFNLNIYEGEFLFVYGFSDSGIRELGEVIAGRRKIESGSFFVMDKALQTAAFNNIWEHGIYIVQNENNLVEDFSVAENLFFGGRKKYYQMVVPRKKQEMIAKRLLDIFDIRLDVKQKAGSLGYMEQITVKILMAVARGARLIIFNDIIGFRVSAEANEKLKRLLIRLKEEKIAVLWLNERMDFARNLSDRILTVQKGKNTLTVYKGHEEALDRLIHKIKTKKRKERDREIYKNQKPYFEMKSISSGNLTNIDFELYRGEIVYVHSENIDYIKEFRDLICGEKVNYSGLMTIEEKVYRPKSYAECMKRGVCLLDIMCFERFCIQDMTIVDNVLIEEYWRKSGVFGIINEINRDYVMTNYRALHPDWPYDYIRNLTADQTKIFLLERLMNSPNKLIIITEPFFQVHANMIGRIMTILEEMRECGKAIILTAAGDSECQTISDRIVEI